MLSRLKIVYIWIKDPSMKIAFIFPRLKYPSGDPPVGMALLSRISYQKLGKPPLVLDTTFYKRPHEIIKQRLEEFKPDLVGISLMTTMLTDALQVAKLIKVILPGSKVLLGGPHPTIAPHETLSEPAVDAVAIGEGEEIISDIIENDIDFENIKGITYRKGNQIISNPPAPVISDLSQLPLPAWELFPMQDYFNNWFQLDCISLNLRGTTVIASRGCPFNCSFCQPTLNKIFGKKLRLREPGSIKKELEYLIDRFDINAFAFQDDTFTVNKDWIYQVCDMLDTLPRRLVWSCNARADLVDEQLFTRMKESGLSKVAIGMESGSQRVLDEIYYKGITLSDIERSVEICKRLKLKVQGFFMLGAPTETKREINHTISYATGLDIDDASFSITTPLYHTHLYEISKKFIARELKDFDYYKTSVYHHPSVLSPRMLSYLKKKAFFSFYFHPKRLPATIKLFTSNAGLRKTFLKLKRL